MAMPLSGNAFATLPIGKSDPLARLITWSVDGPAAAAVSVTYAVPLFPAMSNPTSSVVVVPSAPMVRSVPLLGA